jgi:hypothetical protein
MFGIRSRADEVFQFTKILSSSVANDPATGVNDGLLYSVAGGGSVDFSGDEPIIRLDDDHAEADDAAECFGQLGILARPLPPGSGGYAESLCVKSGDAFVPISHRDNRLRMQGNGPNEGTIAMVGYGGGIMSFDPVDDGDSGTIQVLYCPFDFDADGVAQKAHAITLNPTSGNESISIVHSSGLAITMVDDELVLKNKNGTATIALGNDGITMTGQINLAGSVVIGNPTAAVPLLAGPASPPCSTLFVSP